ncbi:uncharacterized protein B0I36DRAFT_354731 [Microdochium trichocladiopsis]|uniref:Uncharacterized protein n=1 Tax=Microdochium trichocladiopsis TaxID=1682393 RepID=A0A9P9BKF1_9PEZI|nr:uncharacterized protein B0I36DRAFT_354731 [Microdochium trichocladiopsis]KAH7018451.1 hypothetical protein B0I36DRAFT_354731 [Microdochium trichocladiopsis]
MSHMKAVGFKGEKIVFDHLAKKLRNWSYENWTSRLRSRAGFPAFRREEADHADFTYRDTALSMRRWLNKLAVPIDPSWSVYTTYHIEVKTTNKNHKAPFRISDNQLALVSSDSGLV